MSKIAQQISLPIKEEMEIFEKKFYSSMRSTVPLLDRITKYIVTRKGKQMRPMFVFLTAKMLGGFTEKTYRAASLIELIHTATLVHDDVVDESNLRRGFFSINAVWKNKIAVLVGDFLLSKSLLLSCQNKDFDLLEVISLAIQDMSEGELLQIEKARKLDITEEVYFEIIRQKTATLIAACCKAGALSVGSSPELAQNMHRFGELVGISFQIKDDLFDYLQTNAIGKPTGIDIQEKKMTLPLIFALNSSSEKEKKWILDIIKNHNKNKTKVKSLIEFVKEKGGLSYAQKKMTLFRDQALEMLSPFEDSPEKQSLIQMVNYVIEREN
ncbi:MAG: polyprenyl synthetase [Flavobacteriaceae bacterium]|nr:MAG: polyprenyl synthetase [Flavobacteriaceae bacterium]